MPKRIHGCEECGHFDERLYKCKIHLIDVHPSQRNCTAYMSKKDLKRCRNCKNRENMLHGPKLAVPHCKEHKTIVSLDNWCDDFKYDYAKAKKEASHGDRPAAHTTAARRAGGIRATKRSQT